MTGPDLINSVFEAVAGLFVFRNVLALLRHKQIRGVHWSPTFFFSVWGIWNLFYYPHLNQWFSFYGGLLVLTANLTWLVLVFHYRGK